MEIKTTAMAGTLESSDIQITISTGQDGIQIDLDSSVASLYGDQIKKVITDTLMATGIENANVKAVDKGALDCVVKARALAAAQRALERRINPLGRCSNNGRTFTSDDDVRAGEQPGHGQDAGIYGADSIMFDLEDSGLRGYRIGGPG